MSQRRAGRIEVQTNGEIYDAKGWFSYDPGDLRRPKRRAIMGIDGIHGFVETPQAPKEPYIEGLITEPGTLELAELPTLTDVTVTLSITDGKAIVLYNARSVGDGKEKNAVRFCGSEAVEA